jgi:DNA-directed RNA polymerase specialized sigma24 family protein
MTMKLVEEIHRVAATRATALEVHSAITLAGDDPPLVLRRERDGARYAESMATHALMQSVMGPVKGKIRDILRDRPNQEHADAFNFIQFRIADKAATFRGTTDAEVRAWTAKIAHNACLDLLRKAKKQPRTEAWDPPAGEGRGREPGPDDLDPEVRGRLTPPSPDQAAELARYRSALPGLLHVCEEQAVRLVQTNLPDDIRALARKNLIGANEATVRQHVQVWKLCKILQNRQAELQGMGIAVGSIANYNRRGGWAMECGRQRSLHPDTDAVLRDADRPLMTTLQPRAL